MSKNVINSMETWQVHIILQNQETLERGKSLEILWKIFRKRSDERIQGQTTFRELGRILENVGERSGSIHVHTYLQSQHTKECYRRA
jgi:hypothetical protein